MKKTIDEMLIEFITIRQSSAPPGDPIHNVDIHKVIASKSNERPFFKADKE